MALPHLVPLAVSALIGTLVFCVCRCIYNVFWHPLSSVPGPKIHAASQLPYIYHLTRGEWPRRIQKLHETYGPAVRIGPNDVSFLSADAWRQIYSLKTGGEATFDKDRRIYPEPPSGNQSILSATDDNHRRMRRLLSHAFSEQALRGQEAVIQHYVGLLVDKLGENAREGKAVDIVEWLNFTTFDLLGDLAFGEPFGCLENSSYHPWVAMIFKAVAVLPFLESLRRVPLLLPMAAFIVPRDLLRSVKDHAALSEKTVRKRLDASNLDREDFMSYIQRHNHDGDGGDGKGLTMNFAETVENASVMIIAGSETTATLLSGVVYHLLTNRPVYDELVREIRTSFASEDDITMLKVDSTKYLPAVLQEGLRMYPPVPTGLPRYVPEGGRFVEGHWLPEKTSVSISIWASAQSPLHWHEPETFAPERWLGDERFAGDEKGMLNPFSHGARDCIGKNLAKAEMRLILARLLWNFDLEIVPESRGWTKQSIYYLWDKGPLIVKLTPVRKQG